MILVVLAKYVNRVCLTAKSIRRVYIAPSCCGVAKRKAVAGPLEDFPGHFLGELLGWQELAKLVVREDLGGVIVAAVSARHAGFSESHSPGREHGKAEWLETMVEDPRVERHRIEPAPRKRVRVERGA